MSAIFDLTGRIALVTGASSGIGAATARTLAAQGARVALTYHRNRVGANTTCAQIMDDGGEARVFHADLRDPEEIRGLAAEVTKALGSIDILVNNAGSLIRRMKLHELTEAAWDEIQDLNLKSAMLLSQAVVPSMIVRGRGVIVNVGSVAGHHGGGPGAGAYAVAKAGVAALTKALAKELAPHGVRVNSVAPGVIDTPFHEAFSTPEMIRAFTAMIPLGRIGTPAECASVIAFLASDASSFVVGETIDINGGQLMR